MSRFIMEGVLFPGAATQGRDEATVYLGAGDELRRVKTVSGHLVAVAGRRPAAGQPVVMYFYGNAMCLAQAVKSLDWFAGPAGARGMAIAEYLGYGLSTGRASEAGCVETADAAYDFLTADWGVAPSRLVVAGWSLGAAVALDLASRREAAGLALFSPFTRLPDVARAMAPRLLADLVPWLWARVPGPFDNLAKIARVACPIFLAHGREDALIPFAMARVLQHSAAAPVTFVPVAHAGHNDLFETGGDRLRWAFDAFMRDAIAGAP